jgi:serine/threonine protein kinase
MLPGFSPGDVVAGRYRIEELVGRGGFGAVYRATQLNLGRAVALKVLLPELFIGRGSERFYREAELAQRLEHPNSVRLYDFGRTDQGIPYIVWEFLRGRSLEQLILSQGPLSATRVARVGAQVLKALMEAHALGIVHRDIKPSNIMLCDFAGESDFVKLLDLGVAKQLSEPSDARALTEAGHLVGTPSYMAPELVLAGNVTPKTDLYALGLTLADSLAGTQTVQGSSFLEICMRQAAPEPVALSQSVLGSPLAGVIQRAVQKDPALRYDSAQEMLRDIDALALSSRDLAYQPTGIATLSQPLPPQPSMMSTPPAVAATASHPPPVARTSPLLWVFGAIALLGILGTTAVAIVAITMQRDRGASEESGFAKSVKAKNLSSLSEERARERTEKAGYRILDVQRHDSPGYSAIMITATKLPHSGSITIADYGTPETAQTSDNMLRAQGFVTAREGRRVVMITMLPKDKENERLLRMIVDP